MATLAAPTTAEVMSLAELEKHRKMRDKYISTLPYFNKHALFNKDRPPCDCTSTAFFESPSGCKGCNARTAFNSRQAKAIQATEERWVWFSKAEKMDDERGERLGTLGNLPWEIRQEIFKITYDDNFYEDIFHGHNTGFSFEGRNPTTGIWGTDGLRLASPSTKAEVEYLYLSKTHFRFSCPAAFTEFVKQLSTSQHSQLRSVTFQLFNYCYCCHHPRYRSGMDGNPGKDWYRRNTLDWIAVFAMLPQGLTTIKFELARPGRWSLDPTEAEMVHRTLGLLETLTKQAWRRSPGVQFKWTIERYWENYLCFKEPSKEHKETLDDLCKPPENWSKEWLDRWEEAQEGYGMVLSWRKQRQDWSAILLARKSQGVELKQWTP